MRKTPIAIRPPDDAISKKYSPGRASHICGCATDIIEAIGNSSTQPIQFVFKMLQEYQWYHTTNTAAIDT
jgi:hypothetical protein